MEQAEINERHSVLARLHQRRADRAAEDARERDNTFAELGVSKDTFLHQEGSIHHPSVAPPIRANPRCARLRSKVQQLQQSDQVESLHRTSAEFESTTSPVDVQEACAESVNQKQIENYVGRDATQDTSAMQSKALDDSTTIEDVEDAMRQLLAFVHQRTVSLPDVMPMDKQNSPATEYTQEDCSMNSTTACGALVTRENASTCSIISHVRNLAPIQTHDGLDEFDVDSEGSSPSPSHRMTADDEGRLWEVAQRDVIKLLGSTPQSRLLRAEESRNQLHVASLDISSIEACYIPTITKEQSKEFGKRQANDDLINISFRYLRFCICRGMSEAAVQRRAEKRAPLDAAIQRHMDALHDADVEPAVRKLQVEWRKYRMRALFHQMDVSARRLQRFFRRRWLRDRLEREAPLERERLENERRRLAMAPPPPPSRRPQNREPQPKSIDPYNRNPQAWHAPRGNSALLACPPPLKKPHQPRSQFSPTASEHSKTRPSESDIISNSRPPCSNSPQVVEVSSTLIIPPPPRAWPPRCDMSQRLRFDKLQEEAVAPTTLTVSTASLTKKRNLIATMAKGKACRGHSIKSMLPDVATNDTWTVPARALGSPRRKLDIL